MPKATQQDNNTPSDLAHFEQHLTDLTSLVEEMEQGKMPLEQSVQHFEKGVGLIRQCQKALSQVEQKINILTQEQLEPFEA